MILTNRDINVFKFLNDFGIASRETISDLFFIGKSQKRKLGERILRKLYTNDYLTREKCHKTGNFVYTLTLKAIEYLQSEGIITFGLISKIPWYKLVHDYFIHKAVIEFTKNGVREFISERRLKLNPIISYFIPDFAVKLDDDYLLAVEVERTNKTKERIFKKLSRINRSRVFKVVLYICFSEAVSTNVNLCYSKLKNPYFQLVTVFSDDFYEDSSKFIRPIVDTARGEY